MFLHPPVSAQTFSSSPCSPQNINLHTCNQIGGQNSQTYNTSKLQFVNFSSKAMQKTMGEKKTLSKWLDTFMKFNLF